MNWDLEQLTGSEYLTLDRNSRRSGEESARFKQIRAEVKKRPDIQQRLAFDLLRLARGALDQSSDPTPSATLAYCYRDAITVQNISLYLDLVKDIVIRTFHLAGNRLYVADIGLPMLTVSGGLITLQVLSIETFSDTLATLRRTCEKGDPREKLLNEAEEPPLAKLERIRRLSRQLRMQQLESEARAARASN